MPGPKKYLAAIFFLTFSLVILTAIRPTGIARAQDFTTGIASSYPLDDPDAVAGDFICFAAQKSSLERCVKAYDEKIFGVYVPKPQLVLRQKPDEKPIVREGRVFANVTTVNGEIEPGSVLTSSIVPGKAEKATEPIGYVLGRAIGSFKKTDGEKINFSGHEIQSGKVEIALVIGPQGVLPRGTLLDQLGYILVKGTQTPQAAGIFLRYIMAGILTVSVTVFALNNYGRNINKGIEAIGRNPLARSQIHFAMLLNTGLIVALVVGSIILGLVIIRI